LNALAEEIPDFRLSHLVDNILESGGETHLLCSGGGYTRVYFAKMDPMGFLPVVTLVGSYPTSSEIH